MLLSPSSKSRTYTGPRTGGPVWSKNSSEAWGLSTRTLRSIAPFSASAPLHHSLSSADFIANIAEFQFSAYTGTGERRTDQQNIGLLQELIEPVRCPNPVHPLICPAMAVDGVHPHAGAVHQAAGRGADASKAKDFAEPAREHSFLRRTRESAYGDRPQGASRQLLITPLPTYEMGCSEKEPWLHDVV